MPKKLTTEEFITKAISIHGNKYDYSESIYIDSRTKVKIKCKKHNNIFESTPNNHLRNRTCPICAYEVRADKRSLTLEDFISKATTVHGSNYDYSDVVYVNNKTNINIYCKQCTHTFSQRPDAHVDNKSGCPKCNRSHGENAIEQFLIQNNIEYVCQYKFDDCKYKRKLPFDFYLPKHNTCIEFDGHQHTIPVPIFGGSVRLKEQQERDKIKNQYCIDNNICLLRISYKNEKEIESILIYELMESH